MSNLDIKRGMAIALCRAVLKETLYETRDYLHKEIVLAMAVFLVCLVANIFAQAVSAASRAGLQASEAIRGRVL